MKKKLDKQTTDAINDLGRLFSDTTIMMHEAIAKKAGLTGTDHKYLGILIKNGSMTAGELAKLTGLTTGAITGLIDRLEKKELVKREFDKDDRRKILIAPNYENAMKALGPIFNQLQGKMVNLVSTLTDSEIEIIEKYLLSTIEIMEGMTRDLQNEDKII